ncbi:MAG: efflux RND transporter periplasmic adaptor subunit [Verrucomicrobia bacterium]|nr:MAG: efflux RND transporter periplasmic adaptor subunit [Verrucomicrobiota bacterium]
MKPKTIFLTIGVTALTAFVLMTGCGKTDSSPSSQTASAKPTKYFCPMHPTYVSDRPGDCPICNMKLVPVTDEGTSSTGALSSLPGRIAIHLNADKRQLIGLTTSLVQTQRLARTIRASATLSHDETSLARVSPRFAGWVRKLHVNYTGQPVEQGAALFTVYSPELFSAENDYLIALKNSRTQTNAVDAQRVFAGAKRKLELMEVGDAEIRSLAERNQASDELLIRSPVSGHVITKSALEGKAFMAGESLYEIAPLHRLWALAQVYEYELSQLKVGAKARVVFPNLAGKAYESSVAFINPHIDPQTRRAEVRIELENADHVLKPDMWGDAEIEVSAEDVLVVPASAVINTGERDVAFVDRDDGHLEPREVKVGAKTDDYWQVLEGLKSGEKVVTRALFLVDSESQLKAVIAGMGASGEHKH